MISKFRRAATVCLTGIMTFSLAAGSALALAKNNAETVAPAMLDTVNFENVTGKVDLTSVALNNLSASVLENAGYTVKNETRTVIVTLEEDCILDSIPNGSTVAEYLSTYSGSKALKNINTSQQNFLTSLSSLGVDYRVVYKYSNVTNAVAIEVNTKYLSKIKSISSVQSAVVSETYAYPEEQTEVTEATGTENYSNIYETGIYDSSDYVKQGYDGRGMTVAILDTGLDYTHDAFQKMPPAETLGMTKEDLVGKLSTENLNAVQLSASNGENITADDLFINNKVPFAYDYADKDSDVYPAYSQHGVHVAGIVAGDADTYKDKDGNEKENFKGVAPNAQLVICKVFTDNFDSNNLGGAISEDIIAALDDCAALGVDVINMSLGTSAGFSSLYLDGDDEGQALYRVYEKIQKAGISLICAASNDFSSGYGSAFGTNLASNPDSGTVGSPSTFSGALSVASVNGQLSSFLVANEKSVIYYNESSDENGVSNNFVEQMLEGKTSGKFKYVVVGGIGQASDYAMLRSEFANKDGYDKVIAVIKRGTNTFTNKINIARDAGADAVIVYNNVTGTIGMSLGDLEDPIPAISVTKEAGDLLCYDGNRRITTGVIELSVSYQAGPFMNDYSSWGTTPDLKIKPEITSHGGEITSTVSGGYAEMSGTSMASPNMAGFVALLRGKLKAEHPDWEPVELNNRVNQLVMSTAITVLDHDGVPYSPRKQGAGLGTLKNVFSTNAYLYTEYGENYYSLDDGKTYTDVEDGRPKIELGHDKEKTGVYNLTFHVANIDSVMPLSFKTQSIIMTETLDGLAVAEKAYLFKDTDSFTHAVWKADGVNVGEGGTITVQPGESVKIEVTITLSDADKKYLNEKFENGMFVEGFLKLLSETDGQCDLGLPFMGFFGDWFAAPMLDYDCFEIAADQKDTSKLDEEKIQPQIWATQAYATYYNEKYTVPIGSYVYVQDETADQIYAEEEHSAISCWDVYYGEENSSNYMTTTSLKALYAGLLRNAEVVTYDLYDSVTGEIIKSGCDYRISKAISSGGSAVPANVELKLYPEELGLVNNGKYRIDFHFYFREADVQDPEKTTDDNTFSMSFYVDYEAPVLSDARIRYYDYKENNQDKQRVYLDLDIYDNHYAQAVILCYSERENETDTSALYLATPYITPVYNANKNGITTVSIEITDFYEKYSNRLYVQLDDYALNHSVWSINFSASQSAGLPDTFSAVCDENLTVYTSNQNYDYELTVGVNETYKVALDYDGTANLSNFTWETTNWLVADVKNGQIFGVAPGDTTVTVVANGVSKKILVHVVNNGATLSWPSISFGVIENSDRSLVKASGTVRVNAGQDIKLEIVADQWYYPVSNLNLFWETDDKEGNIATVDQNGNVKIFDTKGLVNIKATIVGSSISATVTLSVQEPFTISSGVLSAYHGRGGDVVIPTDKNVTSIATEAFKDNNNITSIIIPKTVTQIGERAFINCTALEEVYFIQKEPMSIPDSNLALILKNAFEGCTSLKKFDLSNVKKITLDAEVFRGCTSLSEVVKMENIGTMNRRAFAGCTSLTEANITGLHNAGSEVFANCTALVNIITDYYTSIGEGMFRGCNNTNFTEITINTSTVSDNAFYGCTNLNKVIFDGADTDYGSVETFRVGSRAFYGCTKLETVEGGDKVSSYGDYAFAGCERLSSIDLDGNAVYGIKVFENTLVSSQDDVDTFGAVYNGTTLVLAPSNIPAGYVIRSNTEEIGAYAFANSTFANGVSLVIPESVTKIGEGAFSGSTLKNITLSQNLTEISAFAFRGTSLESISIPASVAVIGDYAFASIRTLREVTFANSGSRNKNLNLGNAAFYCCTALAQITLPNLVEVDGEVIVPAMLFTGCTALESVDIANATIIGQSAFGSVSFMYGTVPTVIDGCTALTSIDLKNVTVISSGAFDGCVRLASVTGLGRVEEIGAYAFYDNALTSIDLTSASVVGAYAFYGNLESKITIPAGLTGGKTTDYLYVAGIGAGAFANSQNLTAFEVDADNPNYFAEDGVLYRIISGTKDNGEFEICAYPSGKNISATNGVKTYTVKEGTIRVQAYAFSELSQGVVQEIKLPYSVKAIGDGAFYDSGITSFVFESINAPVLETQTYDILSITTILYSLYYTTFGDQFVYYAPIIGERSSRLNISYPTNGIGYDNYVYTYSFGTVTLLGEYMDDNTRIVKDAIEGFHSAETVSSWINLDPNNAENKQMVEDFSDLVKATHALYNNITSETQLEFLGAENIQKLTDIENALKTVKPLFGIRVLVSSLEISPDSTHKTDYKVGEKFDMTGLILIVIYDDYTTEIADMSKVTIVSGYDGELNELNRYVILRYNNDKQIQVRINVITENEGDGPDPDKNGDTKLNPAVIYGPIIGVVALAGIAVGAYFLFRHIKGKKSSAKGETEGGQGE